MSGKESMQSLDTKELDHALDPDHQFRELDMAQEHRWVETKNDPVNNPAHYNRKGVEAIQAIEASMSDDEFRGYCKGNAMKYLWRYQYKGKPVEDLKKCRWYLDKLIASFEQV